MSAVLPRLSQMTPIAFGLNNAVSEFVTVTGIVVLKTVQGGISARTL